MFKQVLMKRSLAGAIVVAVAGFPTAAQAMLNRGVVGPAHATSRVAYTLPRNFHTDAGSGGGYPNHPAAVAYTLPPNFHTDASLRRRLSQPPAHWVLGPTGQLGVPMGRRRDRSSRRRRAARYRRSRYKGHTAACDAAPRRGLRGSPVGWTHGLRSAGSSPSRACVRHCLRPSGHVGGKQVGWANEHRCVGRSRGIVRTPG